MQTNAVHVHEVAFVWGCIHLSPLVNWTWLITNWENPSIYEGFPLHFTTLIGLEKVSLLPGLMCALPIVFARGILYNEDVRCFENWDLPAKAGLFVLELKTWLSIITWSDVEIKSKGWIELDAIQPFCYKIHLLYCSAIKIPFSWHSPKVHYGLNSFNFQFHCLHGA